METKIIDNSDPGIVIKETKIQLSDEKLKSLLLRVYETAQKNTSTFKFYKLYSYFLSIAGTILLALLTSSFNSIGNISAERVTNFAWGICIISAIIGVILLIIAITQKLYYDTSERDAAVDKALNNFFKQQ